MSAYPQFDQLCRIVAAMEREGMGEMPAEIRALGPAAAQDWAGHALGAAELAFETAYLFEARRDPSQCNVADHDLKAYERDGKEAARRLGKPYLGTFYIGDEKSPPEDRPQVQVYALRAGFLE